MGRLRSFIRGRLKGKDTKGEGDKGGEGDKQSPEE